MWGLNCPLTVVRSRRCGSSSQHTHTKLRCGGRKEEGEEEEGDCGRECAARSGLTDGEGIGDPG